MKTVVFISSFLVLLTAFTTNKKSTNNSFDVSTILGTWYQTKGNTPSKEYNVLKLQLEKEVIKGSLKIVESRKVINYNLVIQYDSLQNKWKMVAERDKKAYEWQGSIENNTLYFVREFNEKGDHYFSRQGFHVDGEGNLIRILEKSYDGTNYQGIEEKYMKANE